jgi:hypothetical protein
MYLKAHAGSPFLFPIAFLLPSQCKIRQVDKEKMDRLERLKSKRLDEEEWQKLWNKYQQQYIRKRLQAIKYL